MNRKCVNEKCFLFNKEIHFSGGGHGCVKCGRFTKPCPKNKEEHEQVRRENPKKFSREAYRLHDF